MADKFDFDDFSSFEAPKLDPTAAQNILSNAFQAAGIEKSTIPLDTLTSYANYRMNRLIFQKILAFVMLVTVILVPYHFISARFTLTENQQRTKPGYPIYDLVISSSLPPKSITATINGKAVPMEEAGDQAYALIPFENGEMSTEVVLCNGQRYKKTITVDKVDLTAPTLVSDSLSEDSTTITLTVTDDVTGISPGAVYAVSASGERIKPESVDSDLAGMELTAVFSYPSEDMTAYFPDAAGNTLSVIITPKSTTITTVISN